MTTLAKIWTSAVAYVALAIGAGLSIAGNVADTYRTRGGQTDVLDVVLAVSWPALVVLMVEMFVSTLWPATKPMQAIRWIGCLAIGAMAMRVSWVHLNDLLASRGQDADVATIGPLAIDALAIMATALILSGRGRLATADVASVEAELAMPSDEAIEAATWRDPWELATPVATPAPTFYVGPSGQMYPESLGHAGAVAAEEALAKEKVATEPDVDGEVASWMATTSGQQVLAKAKEKVATAKRPAVTVYDPEYVKAQIRADMEAVTADMAKTQVDEIKRRVDAATAEATGLSLRQARRLRSEAMNQPVSGPPEQDGDL